LDILHAAALFPNPMELREVGPRIATGKPRISVRGNARAVSVMNPGDQSFLSAAFALAHRALASAASLAFCAALIGLRFDVALSFVADCCLPAAILAQRAFAAAEILLLPLETCQNSLWVVAQTCWS
jgi:hypothetical protein